jgi:hypothetical protein
MKTNHPFHSPPSRGVMALLVAAAALALTHGAQAAAQQDIQATITLDREHTSIVDRLPTGQGVNEFRGNNPLAAAVAYTSGGKIAAVIGRNRNIALDGNTSNKADSGRTAYLNFAGGLGCATSVNVNFDGNPGCDPCVNTFPALPDDRFGKVDTDLYSGRPDNFVLTIWGEDYDDLQIGCTVDTFARLEFEIAGQVWAMWWGPYVTGPTAGDTANPESPSIKVTRVSLSEWRFQTTSDHHAALYRRNPNYSHEYHGQFTVKFSGTAVALLGQALPAGNHCNIEALPGALACTPTP